MGFTDSFLSFLSKSIVSRERIVSLRLKMYDNDGIVYDDNISMFERSEDDLYVYYSTTATIPITREVNQPTIELYGTTNTGDTLLILTDQSGYIYQSGWQVIVTITIMLFKKQSLLFYDKLLEYVFIDESITWRIDKIELYNIENELVMVKELETQPSICVSPDNYQVSCIEVIDDSNLEYCFNRVEVKGTITYDNTTSEYSIVLQRDTEICKSQSQEIHLKLYMGVKL